MTNQSPEEKLREAAADHAAEYYDKDCNDKVTMEESVLYENRMHNFIEGAKSDSAKQYWQQKHDEETQFFIQWMNNERYVRYWGSDAKSNDKFYIYGGHVGPISNATMRTTAELLKMFRGLPLKPRP